MPVGKREDPCRACRHYRYNHTPQCAGTNLTVDEEYPLSPIPQSCTCVNFQPLEGVSR